MEDGIAMDKSKFCIDEIACDYKNLAEQFVPVTCLQYQNVNNHISFACEPGQDEFNMPGLNRSSSLAYTILKIDGDFTFCIECKMIGNEKFDGAGIYLVTHHSKVKFGIERYGENDCRIVTVRSSPFSDEANGSGLGSTSSNLVLTRSNNIFSFYSENNNKLRFERAFVDEAPTQVSVGMFVQSPFSKFGAKAIFGKVKITHTSFRHIRR